MQRKELLKKSAIRYAEYYGMVEVQDALYADSASEKIFTNLISIIGSDANIKMAYRNLKSNKGSSTPGVDGKTFKDFCLTIDEAVIYFNIGEKKLRKLVSDNLDSGFIIQNGVKFLIKRKRFEDFLNDLTAI